jgi:hypothetical protein
MVDVLEMGGWQRVLRWRFGCARGFCRGVGKGKILGGVFGHLQGFQRLLQPLCSKVSISHFL